MKRKTSYLLAFALIFTGMLMSSMPAQAAPYSWNFSSTCYGTGACNALTGSYGNVRTAGSTQDSTFKTQVSGYGFTGSGSTAQTAWLGQYSGGLGATNRSEDGTSNSHTVDNKPGTPDDFVVFKFDHQIEFTGYTLTNFSTTDPTPDSVWYLGTSASPLSFTGKTLATLTSSLSGVTSGSGSNASVNVGSGKFGNYLILAANFSHTDDKFKISTVAGNYTPPPPGGGSDVPEPGTLVLLGSGLAALGLVVRKNHAGRRKSDMQQP